MRMVEQDLTAERIIADNNIPATVQRATNVKTSYELMRSQYSVVKNRQ